mmetsp:Transcript_13657/g.50884  ORF Transcript_13657/g.50884 Transcript_13657/m.50884 type:complete len:382 (+) Transcript_13657:683-1828(+)
MQEFEANPPHDAPHLSIAQLHAVAVARITSLTPSALHGSWQTRCPVPNERPAVDPNSAGLEHPVDERDVGGYPGSGVQEEAGDDRIPLSDVILVHLQELACGHRERRDRDARCIAFGFGGARPSALRVQHWLQKVAGYDIRNLHSPQVVTALHLVAVAINPWTNHGPLPAHAIQDVVGHEEHLIAELVALRSITRMHNLRDEAAQAASWYQDLLLKKVVRRHRQVPTEFLQQRLEALHALLLALCGPFPHYRMQRLVHFPLLMRRSAHVGCAEAQTVESHVGIQPLGVASRLLPFRLRKSVLYMPHTSECELVHSIQYDVGARDVEADPQGHLGRDSAEKLGVQRAAFRRETADILKSVFGQQLSCACRKQAQRIGPSLRF